MTDVGNFWSDPSLKPEGGDFMKFENVGDRVEGTIKSLGKKVFDEGTSQEHVIIEIRFQEENTPVLSAGAVLLKKLLWDAKPVVGDRLLVELTAVSKNGTRTLKHFKVDVTRPGGSPEVFTA